MDRAQHGLGAINLPHSSGLSSSSTTSPRFTEMVGGRKPPAPHTDVSVPPSPARRHWRRRLRLWLWHLYAVPRRSVLVGLVAAILVLVFFIFSIVQFVHRQGPFMIFIRVPAVETLAEQLSPPLDVLELPFLDLCNAAEVMETHIRKANGTAERRRLAQMTNLMDRYNHVPADGGASALRWSNATGLPVASSSRSGPVRVRFLTASSKINDYVHIATTAATMAGAKFEMLGHNWRYFSFNKRMSAMLSYVKLEGLTDADVIVGMDSDALMSGEDAYGFMEAFVTSTAASEAEHLSYRVRDIRLGKRMPPMVFNGEYNCMRDQITKNLTECQAPYRVLEKMSVDWAATHNVTLTSDFTKDLNRNQYFNAGVFVARVWALRRWNAGFIDFLHTHRPTLGKDWWCDQSSMGTLYLELRRWELLSGVLDGDSTTLRQLTLRECQTSFYPPLTLPVADRGPHGIPGGLVGYERTGRLVLAVQPEMSGQDIFRIDGHRVPENNMSDSTLAKVLRNTTCALQTSLTGGSQSTHRMHFTPRDYVDCHGVAHPPPECAYRSAVLGLPADATWITPLIWHFAGAGKRAMISHYRGLFPWYTPAMHDPVVRNALVWTLVNAPPTRVFAVDGTSDLSRSTEPLALLPHDGREDLSFFQMCQYRYYEGW